MSNFSKEKLGKMVMLAKKGERGEKSNAIRLVKRICKENDLDYKDVMRDRKTEEFNIDFKRSEKKLVVQIVARYALLSDSDGWNFSYSGIRIYFTTTKEKFIETLYAFEILRKFYKKEMEKMREVAFYGFLEKHNLYYQPTEKERKKKNKKPEKISAKEKKLRQVGWEMSKHMDDANIRKALKSETSF